jgi:hypothetical protein
MADRNADSTVVSLQLSEPQNLEVQNGLLRFEIRHSAFDVYTDRPKRLRSDR